MWKIEWLFESISTQKDLKNRISQQADSHLVLATANQTQGLGRNGRFWEAPVGNLSFSFNTPVKKPERCYQLGLVAAVTVMQVLKQQFSLAFSLKWPNDIYYQNKKIAGILSEYLPEKQTVLIGMGINLNSDLADFNLDLRENVNTIKNITGRESDAKDFLNLFLESFAENKTLYEQQGLSTFLEECHENLLWKNEVVQILDHDRIVSEGICEGISEKGFLLLKTGEALAEIVAGDLSLKKKAFVT